MHEKFSGSFPDYTIFICKLPADRGGGGIVSAGQKKGKNLYVAMKKWEPQQLTLDNSKSEEGQSEY